MNGEVDPLTQVYFNWLYSQVHKVETDEPDHSYWQLLEILHSIEYEYHVPHDDSRAADGRNLRREFTSQTGHSGSPEWYSQECSMFEMMLALSNRLEFQTALDSAGWFSILMGHLGLHTFNDASINRTAIRKIHKACRIVNERSYTRDGRGGLFPISNPEFDVRDFDLWYQMSIYLSEHWI